MTDKISERKSRIKLSYTGKTGEKLHAMGGCSTKLGNHYVGNQFFTEEEFDSLPKGNLCEKCVEDMTFDQIARQWGVWVKQLKERPWDKPIWKRQVVE